MNKTEMIAVVWLFVSPWAFVTKPVTIFPASSGFVRNVPATTFTNEAITRIKTRSAKIMKSLFEVFPIEALMISPTDFPSFRAEAKSEPKSCKPPKKIPPITHHKKTGTQPKTAARIGPLIGPAPAIEEKWCPIKTAGFAVT